MAALFTIPPPLSSTSSSSLPASEGETPATALQEGGGTSRSDEGEDADGQENISGNTNHKSLRHHVSSAPNSGVVLTRPNAIVSPHWLFNVASCDYCTWLDGSLRVCIIHKTFQNKSPTMLHL